MRLPRGSGSFGSRRPGLLWRHLALVFIAVAISGLSFAEQKTGVGPTQARDDIGFVLEMRGEWKRTSPQGPILEVGQSVQAGEHLFLSHPRGTRAYVKIPLFDDHLITFVCPPELTCDEGFLLPDHLETGTSQVGRIVSAVKALFGTQPRRYVAAQVRGAGRLPDSVLKLESSKVDLSAVLASLPPGRYRCAFTRLRGRSSPARQVTVQTGPGEATAVDLGDIEPDLYLLRVTFPDATASEAWCLLSSPARFSADADAVEEARVMVQSWGEDRASGAGATFMRAAMDARASTP